MSRPVLGLAVGAILGFLNGFGLVLPGSAALDAHDRGRLHIERTGDRSHRGTRCSVASVHGTRDWSRSPRWLRPQFACRDRARWSLP
jgi:hypothetical protein